MVSPVPDEKECKKIKRYSHYCLAHQPVDLREGVAKAYSVVKEVWVLVCLIMLGLLMLLYVDFERDSSSKTEMTINHFK